MPTTLTDIRSFTLDYFNLAGGNLQTRIRDLQIDSLDLVEFLMALEEKLQMEIDTDEIDQDMTLEQFCQLVEKRG